MDTGMRAMIAHLERRNMEYELEEDEVQVSFEAEYRPQRWRVTVVDTGDALCFRCDLPMTLPEPQRAGAMALAAAVNLRRSMETFVVDMRTGKAACKTHLLYGGVDQVEDRTITQAISFLLSRCTDVAVLLARLALGEEGPEYLVQWVLDRHALPKDPRRRPESALQAKLRREFDKENKKEGLRRKAQARAKGDMDRARGRIELIAWLRDKGVFVSDEARKNADEALRQAEKVFGRAGGAAQENNEDHDDDQKEAC